MNAELIIAAALAAHEANRSWCIAHRDYSQPHWEAAPEWQRQSAIKGVEALVENPLLNPIDLHGLWMDVKRADGWKYGPIKDPALKVHPCMVPYHELPAEQRGKDHIFSAVVKSFITAAGVQS